MTSVNHITWKMYIATIETSNAMTLEFRIQPLTEDAKKLYGSVSNTYAGAYIGDAGIDLFVTKDETVHQGAIGYKIALDIACELIDSRTNENYSYYLYPRSSIVKTPLRLANSVGIIDSKYRHMIIASVDNISEAPFRLEKGMRLFQLCTPDLRSVRAVIVDQLSESSRGSGFGSSGK